MKGWQFRCTLKFCLSESFEQLLSILGNWVAFNLAEFDAVTANLAEQS